MLTSFDLVALVLVVTALFAWINNVLIHLPHTIGVLVLGLGASLVLIMLEIGLPQNSFYEELSALLLRLDFSQAVLDGMLAFLLFAGALHVDVAALRDRAWPVGLMATAGVLLSTIVVGLGIWGVAKLVGQPVSFAWALVFGALISPTDPVAVLSTLKTIRVPGTLKTDMAGESLFNDGVGVVVFTVLLAVATGQGEATLAEVAELFFVEALGGAVLGLLVGYLAYRATRAIDDYPIEVLISLALVMGCYSVAGWLHMSGPIAVVVAGILLGNRGPRDAMSDLTQRYLFGFWQLVDEILNLVLFLLIGLEVLVLTLEPSFALLAVAAIPITLVGRLVSVAAPVAVLQRIRHFVPGTVPVLVWGGLRGGISIALALSLPEVPAKPPLLIATYGVVLFTIVVQGLTLKRVVVRTTGAQEAPDQP